MSQVIRKFLFLLFPLGTFVLIFSPLIFPFPTKFISTFMVLLGLGVSILLAVQRHCKAQRAGKITFTFMRRAIMLDITGLLLTMGLAMFLAAKTGAIAAQTAGTTWGATVGILAAIVAGLIVGAAVGLLMRWIWRKLTKLILEKLARPA